MVPNSDSMLIRDKYGAIIGSGFTHFGP